jgi:hypothetical protein
MNVADAETVAAEPKTATSLGIMGQPAGAVKDPLVGSQVSVDNGVLDSTGDQVGVQRYKTAFADFTDLSLSEASAVIHTQEPASGCSAELVIRNRPCLVERHCACHDEPGQGTRPGPHVS